MEFLMTRPVTFSPEALAAIVNAVQQALDAKKSGKTVTGVTPLNAKSERSIKNEIAVVRAFKKAGFGDVKPHIDVKTFNRWMADGMRPIEGSKSLKVKNLRLFHVKQVRALTAEEKQEAQAKSDAAIAEYDQSQPAAPERQRGESKAKEDQNKADNVVPIQ